MRRPYREPSRAVQFGFVALLVVSIAQVAYWMFDYILYAREVENRLAAQFEAEAAAVNALIAGGQDAAVLDRLMAHVVVADGVAVVPPHALAELAARRASITNRVLWEGGFFLLVLVAGLLVLTRAIRHEAALRRRQQNFLAAVSHEFKSPIASLRLAAETLVMRAKEEDSRRLGARMIEDSVRLERMVQNLLETTRLEEGKHRLRPVLIDVRPAVEAAVADFVERARGHGIAIEIDVADGLVLAVDPSAFDSALRNFVDNALKATIAGGGRLVAVRVAAAPGGVELTVSDDGIGFPPEDARMIFAKFYRAGDEETRATPGTGLGLYIVRRLVELSGGRVGAASAGPGHGATVRAFWPQRSTDQA